MRIQVCRNLRRSLAQPAPQSMSHEIRPAGQGFMLLILKAPKDGDCRTILGVCLTSGLPLWWRCLGLYTVKPPLFQLVPILFHSSTEPCSKQTDCVFPITWLQLLGLCSSVSPQPSLLQAGQNLIARCVVCVTQMCQIFTWPSLFSVPAWFDHLHCSCPAGQMLHEI